MPFAIIGSEDEVEVDGQVVRARVYPWGIVEVDNPKHSDFSRLRSALLSSHLSDLKVCATSGKVLIHNAEALYHPGVDARRLVRDVSYGEAVPSCALRRPVRTYVGRFLWPCLVPTLISFRCYSDSVLPEDLATQSIRLKEEQLRREEEKVGFFACISV